MGCFLKHCANINSFLIIKVVFLNTISFDRPTGMFGLFVGEHNSKRMAFGLVKLSC